MNDFQSLNEQLSKLEQHQVFLESNIRKTTACILGVVGMLEKDVDRKTILTFIEESFRA